MARDYAVAMYSNMREMNKGILKTSSNYLILQSLGVFFEELTPPLYTVNFSPFAAWSIITDSLKTAFDIILKAMIVTKATEIFFDFVQNTFYPSFLVLGIVFRAFFMTRRLGGLLIALAVGLYFVFPMVYLLAHAIMGAATSYSYVLILDSSSMDELAMKKNPATGNYEPYDRDAATGKVKPSLLGKLSTKLRDFIKSDWLLGDNGILDMTARILIYSTFVPFVALITTISFVKIFSQTLGGDVEIAGLTKLI